MALNRLIIAGGGLAGSLGALALAKRRPDLELLLIEQSASFGGNHTWSYFDTDIAAADRWVLDSVRTCHWQDHEIRFPKRRRIIDVGYNSLRSEDLDHAVRMGLKGDSYVLGQPITHLSETSIALADGRRFTADAVIDARGPSAMPGQLLGYQKFVGRIYSGAAHGVQRPVIMDATIPQQDGYRFLYLLPLDRSKLLIEDTYYSDSPDLDRAAIRDGLDRSASEYAAGQLHCETEEEGVLPILIEGDFAALWPEHDLVPRLGVRGGFFHPTTSYSLPDAVANAAFLAGQSDFRAASLRTLLRERAAKSWKKRHHFQLLNRMLFRAARPEQRYRVLEHFYRLPPQVIARFYAARLTRLDMLRILSGKPPVSIRKALPALRRRMSS